MVPYFMVMGDMAVIAVMALVARDLVVMGMAIPLTIHLIMLIRQP